MAAFWPTMGCIVICPGENVTFLLKISAAIDWLNERVGQMVMWLLLLAVLISAGNATIRKVFDMSSNAFLEIQWYLFSAIFLLCAGYTFKRNEHVRIDVIIGRVSKRTQCWMDIFGILFFMLPICLFILKDGWNFFMLSWEVQEISSDAGGLIRWPVKILIPLGFSLLFLQGISELIKRVGFLRGRVEKLWEKDVGAH